MDTIPFKIIKQVWITTSASILLLHLANNQNDYKPMSLQLKTTTSFWDLGYTFNVNVYIKENLRITEICFLFLNWLFYLFFICSFKFIIISTFPGKLQWHTEPWQMDVEQAFFNHSTRLLNDRKPCTKLILMLV